MDSLTVFRSQRFGEVRTVFINGKEHFVAVDVARSLGYANPNDAVTRHCRGYVKHAVGVQTGIKADRSPAIQKVEMNCIPFGDICRLVSHSELPGAEAYESWIYDEVLPAIHKTGGYVADTEKFVDSYFQGLPPAARLVLVTALDESKRANEQLAIAAPKAEGYDRLMSSGDCIDVGEMAKLLKTGQNRLFRFLRDQRILMIDNKPYQPHIDAGRFRLIEQTCEDKAREKHISFKTVITAKGQEYIRKAWALHGVESSVTSRKAN